MSRRHNQEPAFNFLAFQDIITLTIGLLIVITLLLSLSIGTTRIKREIDKQKSNAPSAEAVARAHQQLQALSKERDDRLALQKQIETKQAELLAYLQAEVDSLETAGRARAERQQYRRVTPPTQSGLSHPLLIVAQGDHLNIIDQAGKIVRTLDGSRGDSHLQSELQQAVVKPCTGILFLIKPSAFYYYKGIVTLGLKTRFPFGFDIIPEDWDVSL